VEIIKVKMQRTIGNLLLISIGITFVIMIIQRYFLAPDDDANVVLSILRLISSWAFPVLFIWWLILVIF